jgi:tetratricopeptide (TPR) repeat protein
LRLIRQRLATLGLDWDAPAFPDASARIPSGPLKVTVDPGALASKIDTPEAIIERQTARLKDRPDDAAAHHQRGHALFRLKRYEEAIADFTAALKVRPNDAHLLASRGSAEASLKRLDEAIADCEAALRQEPAPADQESLARLCNNLAWTLVSRPAPTADPARALNLARRAVELTPNRATYHNTLGVVLYRAGRYAEAVPVLERSLAAGNGQADAFDLFFLAMAHHQLGQMTQAQADFDRQMAQARADFDRAVCWRRDHLNLPHPHWAAELDAFQAEAQSLLEGPPPELPADVFAPERPSRP